MKLLSILPIERNIRKETLTYFSSEDIKSGTIVSIPLRRKDVQGIVLGTQDAMEVKSEIKDMKFSIKKIGRYKNDITLPSYLLEASKSIATNYAMSIGAVMSQIVPKVCLENPEIFFKLNTPQNQKKSFEILAIQAQNEDRYDTYKSIIRESFAKKQSIVVIAPTESQSKDIAEQLSKGISEYTIIFPDKESKKKLSSWHKKLIEEDHPILAIGTFDMLALLPKNTSTIILEEESSQYYKSRRAPYLDIRKSSTEIARSLGSRIIYGDKLLSVETLARVKSGDINEYSRISKRNTHKIQTLLVDIKGEKSDSTNKKWEIFSQDLREMILYSIKNNKTLFIYSVRKGLSPITICNDCGNTVLCDECESPVVLHKSKSPNQAEVNTEKQKFICHHCGKSRSSLEKCKHCEGWNLVSYGIGIELIEETINKMFGVEVLRIDGDNTKSPEEAKNKIQKFLNREYNTNILVGTEIALRNLPDMSVDFATIPSIESIHSLPDFRTNERIMHILTDVKSKAKECMLIQTRDPRSKIIEQGLSGDLEGFARDEINARKSFGYPPFVNLVKLTITGKKDKIKIDVTQIMTILSKWNPRMFPAFIKSVKGLTLLHILIKVPKASWPDESLREILLSLPQNIKIDTTPQSLL